MKILALRQVSFRNLAFERFEAGEGINVIAGPNGQGKTNLIEALWLFTGAKSFRGVRDVGLKKNGAPFARLELEFWAKGMESEAKITIEENRKAVLNGVALSSPQKLGGELCCVVFAPEHLALIKSGPEIRRRFLDTLICQLRPEAIELFARYAKIMAQRNRLLKDIPFHSQLMDTLDVWDRKLAETGAGVARLRSRYVSALTREACQLYEGISGGKEQMGLRFLPGGYAEEENEAAALYRALKEGLNADLAAGFTSVGPHRDDMELTLDGNPMKSFASQGQQRSAAVALKLAESRMMADLCGEAPVILLDDVMSELDESRQEYILNHIEGSQVFITCCDPGVGSLMKKGRCFHMENGVLRPDTSLL